MRRNEKEEEKSKMIICTYNTIHYIIIYNLQKFRFNSTYRNFYSLNPKLMGKANLE